MHDSYEFWISWRKGWLGRGGWAWRGALDYLAWNAQGRSFLVSQHISFIVSLSCSADCSVCS